MNFYLRQTDTGWVAVVNGGWWSASADTRDAVAQKCREHVEAVTGRPVSETTVTFYW